MKTFAIGLIIAASAFGIRAFAAEPTVYQCETVYKKTKDNGSSSIKKYAKDDSKHDLFFMTAEGKKLTAKQAAKALETKDDE